jgi:arsenate reductase-like glutaredoxin family protein
MSGEDYSNVRIYGKANCLETSRAVQFFVETGAKHIFRSLRRGIAVNDLRIAVECVGAQKVFDREGERMQERRLHANIPDGLLESVMLEDALLCRAPVVVHGKQATVGYCPDVWKKWVTEKPVSTVEEPPPRESATSRERSTRG